jgi:hypothetical protein
MPFISFPTNNYQTERTDTPSGLVKKRGAHAVSFKNRNLNHVKSSPKINNIAVSYPS